MKRKTSRAWSEVCWFVECPYCGDVCDLGDAAVVEDKIEECQQCSKKFLMEKGSER